MSPVIGRESRRAQPRATRSARRVIVALCCIGALGSPVAHAAGTDPAAPRSTATPTSRSTHPADTVGTVGTTPTDTTPVDTDRPLTPEEVTRQVAQGMKLQSDLATANDQIAAASAKLAELSAKSQAAMNALATARAAEQAATVEEAKQLAILRKLNAQAAQAKADLDQMAYDAYVNGTGLLTDVAAILDVVGTGGAPSSAAIVDYLAQGRKADKDKFTSLSQAQQITAARAAAARKSKETARAQAEKAAAVASAAVRDQQAALATYQTAAQSAAAKLGDLGLPANVLKPGAVPADVPNLDTTPLCSEDNGTYRNGFLPNSALCPIPGYPGHKMRPKAARALTALSKAYLRDFGTPLCVTDTYRDYASQVDVRRRKPTLAAVPGTSNHGWGLATDLCGGIQSFGTAQFLWMKQNAPLFGFYHPDWAEPNGSKPEPWHWEFLNN